MFLIRAAYLAVGLSGAAFAAVLYLPSGWQQAHPFAFPHMSPNAAVGIALAGFMLFVCDLLRFRLARAAALLLGCFAGASLLQHLTGLDLGIDRILFHGVHGDMRTYVLHPGRMAPDTAICLLTLALSVILVVKPKTRPLSSAFFSVTISLMLSCGALAIYGAVFEADPLRSIGTFSRMSLYSGILFSVLAVAMALRMLLEHRREGLSRQYVGPILLSALMTVVSTALWQMSIESEIRGIEGQTDLKANAIESQITQGFEERILSLERMARRLDFKPDPDRAAWERDADQYLRQLKGIRTLSIVGPDYRVHWLEPSKGLESFLGFDMSKDPVRKDVLDRARRTGKAAYSPFLEFKIGGHGIIVVLPLHPDRSVGGYLMATLVPQDFLTAILHLDGFEARIEEQGVDVFTTLSLPDRYRERWSDKYELVSGPSHWEMELVPTPATIRAHESPLPHLILFVGTIMSVLLGVVMGLANHSRRQSRLIAEQGHFLKSVIDFAPLPIFTLDPAGAVQSWNPACERVFGWKAEEVIGRLLPFVPEELREGSRKIIEQIMTTRQPYFGEAVRRRRDGTEIEVSVASVALMDAEGKPQGLMAILSDISRAKASERVLERAREAAERASQAKADFLANVSHEIRTPLNGIIGMTDLLLDTRLDEEQRRYADIVSTSGAQLLALINDILDLSKIEAGRMEMESSAFSPASVVESQAELLMAKAREKSLSLATYVSPQVPPLLLGDAGRLSQVLVNLISNAIKFTDRGGVVVRVGPDETPYCDDGRFRLRVSVQDTGIGITQDVKARLFQPFTQGEASTSRRFGGTGLGLSICKRLVERMDGEIGAESEPGSGSRFWFVVKLRPVVSAPVAKRDETDLILGRRAIVIDEDALAAEIASEYLRSWGLRLSTATSFEQATGLVRAAIAERDPFDLAIVGENGDAGAAIALAREIRAAAAGGKPKIVFVAHFEGASRAEAERSGLFSSLIGKPVRQSSLYDAIVGSLGIASVSKPAAEKDAARGIDPTAGPAGHILVVDDVSANQLLAVKLLENLGYASHAVANGREAIEALKLRPYDLVLMDCQMPEMDGFEATRIIRADPQLRLVPIVALTANAMSGDDTRCREAGMDDYLPKPLKKAKLLEALRKWVPAGRERRLAA